MLMAVYNDLSRDGRVLRAATALGTDWDLTVLSVRGRTTVRGKPFISRTIALPKAKLLRPLALFWFWLRLIVAAIRLRPEVFYAHDYFLPLPALWIKRLTGCRVVYDAHELIVPEPGERTSRRDRLFQFGERRLMPHADLVIAANDERAAVMQEFYRLSRRPVVIRNIPPAPGTSDRSDRSDPRVRVVYQGVMAVRRGLDRLVQAAALLPENFELIAFGDGPDLVELKRLAASGPAADRIHFAGSVPWDELHEAIAAAEIGVVMYPATGRNNVYCASNKIFEYAQAGLAIVATDQPPLRNAIEEYWIGEAFPAAAIGETGPDPAEIAAAIRRVAGDLPSYRQRLPRFLQDHRWEAEAERLVRAVAGLRSRPDVSVRRRAA